MRAKQINNILILIFSFFLAFGKYDPFHTGGLYFDALTVLVLISIISTSDVLRNVRLYKKELVYLVLVLILFFTAALFYGYSYVDKPIFNFKLLSAIIIYWFFAYEFRNDNRLCYHSIMVYSISCSLIAVLYHAGFLDAHWEINKGRLIIFEENPNSISSRMAIAAIILVYNLIERPLWKSKWNYLAALGVPSIFIMIVETGSRGSFMSLILGFGLIVLFSKIKTSWKVVLIMVSIFITARVFVFIEGSTLLTRLTAEDKTAGRELIWKNALQIFYDHPWGIGEGGYVTEMMKRYSMHNDTHNLFIYLLICGGWISLILFTMFLMRLWKNVWNNFKTGNSLTLCVFVFLIFLASKTGGVITYLIMWYFFAVIRSFNLNSLKTQMLSHA